MQCISKTISKCVPHGIHLKYKKPCFQDQTPMIMYLYVTPRIHSLSYAFSRTTNAPQLSASGEIPFFFLHISGFM